jgi:(2Fe-2S) ferredoxin
VPHDPRSARVPGLTACSLCAGETLGDQEEPGAQLDRLQRLADDGVARLTLSECLDECERGDVVVARPVGACRRAGARPVWFERLAGEAATGELARWLRSGGPGAAPVPAALAENVITRSATDDDES